MPPLSQKSPFIKENGKYKGMSSAEMIPGQLLIFYTLNSTCTVLNKQYVYSTEQTNLKLL